MPMNPDGLEKFLFHWVMPIAEIATFAIWFFVRTLREIIDIIRCK